MGEAISQWSNWSGYVTATPQAFAEPQNLDELERCYSQLAAGRFASLGTGHSFTPLVKNDGTILSLDRFEGLRSHDPEKLTARVGAGTKIGALAKLLHGVGQALPNMGDIDKQAFRRRARHRHPWLGHHARRLSYPARGDADRRRARRGQGVRPRQEPRHDRCHGRLARRLRRGHRSDDPQHGELPDAASPLDGADRRCAVAIRGNDDGASFGGVLLCAVFRPGAADRQRHHRGAGDGAPADGGRRCGDDAAAAARLSQLVSLAAPPSHRFGLRKSA